MEPLKTILRCPYTPYSTYIRPSRGLLLRSLLSADVSLSFESSTEDFVFMESAHRVVDELSPYEFLV